LQITQKVLREEVTSPASRETVETVFECSRLWGTGLKPVVNEIDPLSENDCAAGRG